MKKLLSNQRVRGALRNMRDGGFRSAWEFLNDQQIYKILPRFVTNYATNEFEIHVLTGSVRLTMALWMAASWMVATESSWRFIFHDDGTLKESDAKRIGRILPSSRVILSSESDRHVSALLKDHPLALEFRNLHPLKRKLVDIPIYTSQSLLLSIDTDILFYHSPERILKWMEESSPPCLFLKDIQDATLLGPDDVRQIFGVPLVQRVNTGIVAVPRDVVTLDFLESALAKTGLMKHDRWYIEQTLYAVAASVYGRVEFLPDDYFMSLNPPCPENAVARHYMGGNRHLFYSEGLPRFQGMLRRIPLPLPSGRQIS